MRPCRACGTANDDSYRFCGACGASLGGDPCPSCGFLNSGGQRFCGHCGTTLTGERPAPVAAIRPADERKLATVLFADVVGFTTMAEHADPEAVAGKVDAAFRRMATVVADHGGTVDKYMGDCLMAVFGVPSAHDDDAERAIAAALAMHDLTGSLTFSIGINTGEVLVTAVAGEGGVTVIGDAVNVAARLEKAAAAGEVLVGPLTAELARRRVVLEQRQSVVLKGRHQPVEVWRATGLLGQRMVKTDIAPLVGRQDELAFLLAHWRRARDESRPGVILVTGEAGIGKTRLLEELVCAAKGEGHIARAACPAYGGLGGPRVAAQIINDLGRSGEPDVDARVHSMAGELHPSLKSIDPNALHHEQLWAFRRLLEVKAEERPLLMVVDDMHNSSEKMQELLSNLALRVGRMRLLLVLTGRPEAGWLTRFPSATTLRLEPLGGADATQLAASFGAAADPAEVGPVVERSGGNPLYLRELVAMTARSGQGVSAGALPPSLHAILAARLDALDAIEKLALQHAAVLGGSARPDQIEALGPEGASRALRALVAAGLLAHTPDGTYEVADPLLREVAYEALPHRARADLHKTAASIAVDDEERARHLELAATHDPRNVSVRAEAAAATAAAASGLIDTGRVVDGIRLFQRAIDLGFREPEGLIALARRLTENSRDAEALAVVELLPDDAEDPTVAIEKIHVRAVALLQDQPAEAVALLDEAAERWRALGRQEKVGWAYANQAVAYFVLGQLEDTGRALDLADGHFSAAGSRQGQLAVTGMQQLARPDDPRILGWLHEALEYAVSSGDRSRQRGVVSGLAWHHYLQARFGGELDQLMADTYLIRFGALGRELGSDVDQLTTLVLRSNMARMSGQLALAADLIGRSCGLSAGTDFEEIFERAGTFAAALAADSAASLAAPPLAAEITDPRAGLAQMMVIEALLLAGRVDDAVAVLTEVHTVGQMGAVGVVSQGLAEGLRWLLTGRFDRAEAAARAMAEAAERVGARPALVAARAMLAEALWCTGRSDDALALLDQLAGDPVGGLAGALVLRARAVAGDPAAFAALPAELARLAAPGLALNPEVSA